MITFTIIGNQEDSKGNPIGYHRTTQGSYWNEGSRRYSAWKSHVINAYIKAIEQSKVIKRSEKAEVKGKAIDLGKSKAYLHTMIYYASNARPDPDNVQKGIADALFLNDKNVAGSYDFALAEDKRGRVEVKIIIN